MNKQLAYRLSFVMPPPTKTPTRVTTSAPIPATTNTPSPLSWRRAERREGGFSVLEVMVGLVIFTIVMGAVYGLLQVGRSGRLNTNARAEIMQNSRIALNTIGRDIINSGVGYPNVGALIPDDRLTGLFGGAADAGTDPDFVTPLYARNNVNSVNGTLTDQLGIAFIDDSFNGGVSLPISDITNNGRDLTISSGFTNANSQVGDLYLIGGQTSTAALGLLTAKSGNSLLQFQNTDALNINQPGAASAINLIQLPASLQRVNLALYYVTDEDGTGMGSGTLMRNIYGGATGWTAQPLAFGIQNFQIQYILKNGAVVDAPSADQMLNIRQVRISITVRSPEVDPRTNQPYTQTLSATYSARNLDYEKF